MINLYKKLQTTAYRKNRNSNQTNEMESNFSRLEKRKKQPVKVWIMQFKIPPPVKELPAFESELIELVKIIKF